MTDPHQRAQLERAHGTWALMVRESAQDPERVERVRRALRLKRFEAATLAERLPGSVRRGARVDLLPLLERLLAAGIDAELIERQGGSTCDTP